MTSLLDPPGKGRHKIRQENNTPMKNLTAAFLFLGLLTGSAAEKEIERSWHH
jgi:hypothetical protein